MVVRMGVGSGWCATSGVRRVAMVVLVLMVVVVLEVLAVVMIGIRACVARMRLTKQTVAAAGNVASRRGQRQQARQLVLAARAVGQRVLLLLLTQQRRRLGVRLVGVQRLVSRKPLLLLLQTAQIRRRTDGAVLVATAAAAIGCFVKRCGSCVHQ